MQIFLEKPELNQSQLLIRPFQEQYLEWLMKVADFPLNRHRAVAEAVVEKNGIPVAYGSLKPFMNADMVVDGLKIREKIEAIDLLHRQAITQTDLARFDQLYVFCDENFAKILRKHYGYRDCVGRILVRDL